MRSQIIVMAIKTAVKVSGEQKRINPMFGYVDQKPVVGKNANFINVIGGVQLL